MQTQPNITTNPAAKKAFDAAIKAENWLEALSIVTSASCTVTPSQAPTLKAALLARPELLKTGTFVAIADTSKREVNGACLAPDIDAAGNVTETWAKEGPQTLEQRFPHFSANWEHLYQVHHFMAFQQVAQAGQVLRRHDLSCLFTDYDGKLAAHMRATYRNDIQQNAVSIACPIHPHDR